jgi:putative cell wall-binding protein
MRKKILLIFPMVILLFLTSIGTVYASQNPTVNRLAGYDRYETASQIAKAGWQQSDYAILAYGENYPDALAAVPLANKLNAPILLTDKFSLNPKTSTVLQDLKVKTVYVVGGTAVISADAENQLTNSGYSVKRIAGQDKYDTAIKIAEELGDVKEVAVTTGGDYADALSIGPIAANKQMPIILVPKDDITSSIQNYISSKTITKTYVIGGQDIISDNVVNKFSNPERITGQDKYARNIAVLNRFADLYQKDKICLATGENFADALAGAVYAAKNNGAVALVKGDLPASTSQFLKGNITSSSNVTIFGGEAVVPSSMLESITNSGDNITDKIDFGSLNGQIYTNKFFGLTITIPSQFTIGDNVALTKVAKDNINLANPSNASDYNNVILLYATKKFDNATEQSTFIAEAEKLNSNYSNADEYIAYGEKLLSQSPIKFVFPKDIYSEKINGVDFRVLEFYVNLNSSITLSGKLYTTIQNGYAVSFSTIRTNNIDTSDLDQIFSSIQFNN